MMLPSYPPVNWETRSDCEQESFKSAPGDHVDVDTPKHGTREKSNKQKRKFRQKKSHRLSRHERSASDDSYGTSRSWSSEGERRKKGMSKPYADVVEDEDVIMEKQSILMELERLRHRGVHHTRTYTLKDSIADMKFELRRHLLNIEESNAVSFMRDAMRIAFTGIEFANNSIGPFLHLDGWSSEMSRDMGKYDHALSGLYKKYWRRSSTSPEMQLTIGIVGSMAMHHFKSTMSPFVSPRHEHTSFADRKRGDASMVSPFHAYEQPPP
eukprot:643177-Pleurochrysis_carterae.AAC.1